jgi:hypothetical protein
MLDYESEVLGRMIWCGFKAEWMSYCFLSRSPHTIVGQKRTLLDKSWLAMPVRVGPEFL